MLVAGLKSESLSRIASRSDADCTDVHKALRECAEEMLYKYKQKQAQKNTEKPGIKIHSTEILLLELSKVPEDPDATRSAILSALKRHAEVLQNHEHLLSEKGNTYALLEQTRSFMERHGEASASLLRYHDLKNKLLGPDTLLDARQINAIRALGEKQGLTLKMLEIMEMFPVRTGTALEVLHEADLLEPEVCAIVLEHKHSPAAARTLFKLKKTGLSKAQLSGLCPELCKHEDKDLRMVACAIAELCHHKLDTPDNCSAVIKHSNPPDVADAIIYLHDNPLFPCQPLAVVIQDLVLQHETPLMVAMALVILKKGNMLIAELCARVLRHKKPYEAAEYIVELKQRKLNTLANCLAVLETEDTDSAIGVIIHLHSRNLLTEEKRDQVLKHKASISAALAMETLDKAGLCISYLCAEVLKHEDPESAAHAFVELFRHKLCTPYLWSVAFGHKCPAYVAKGIIHLHSCNLLTYENIEQIIAKEDPFEASEALVILKKAKLFNPELYAEMFKYKYPAKAARAMIILNDAGLFKPDFCTEVLVHSFN